MTSETRSLDPSVILSVFPWMLPAFVAETIGIVMMAAGELPPMSVGLWLALLVVSGFPAALVGGFRRVEVKRGIDANHVVGRRVFIIAGPVIALIVAAVAIGTTGTGASEWAWGVGILFAAVFTAPVAWRIVARSDIASTDRGSD